MVAEDVMTRSLYIAAPGTLLPEAARKMRDNDIGALPVMSGDRIVGMLTDRDIVVRGLAVKTDLATVPVQDVMTSNPISCHPQDSLEEVAKIFSEKKIRRMLVVDDAGRPVGIVSLGDLATGVNNPPLIQETLRQVSMPTHH